MRVTVLSPVRLGPRNAYVQVAKLSSRAQINFHSQQHIFCGAPRLIRQRPSSPGAATFVTTSFRSVSHEQTARDLNQQGVDEALSEFDSAVVEDSEKQRRAPWHRQGVEEPPVRKQRSAGAMTKGKAPSPICLQGRTC